jgi:hypothetical protein
MDEQAATISIICVSYNETNALARLKTSIDRLERPEGIRVETILVDGGSTDGTASRARELDFTRVHVEPDASIPVCRNIGARIATGAFLAYVDADCELSVTWLINSHQHLNASSPRLLGWPAAPPSTNATWVQRAWHTHWSNKLRAAIEEEPEDLVRNQAFRLITTRNLIMNSTVFDAVGGFDETLSTGEDTDFALQATRKGIEVCGLPSLHAVHHGEPASLAQFFRQQRWHANRRSYRKILSGGSGIEGLHAPVFTVLFLAASILAIACIGMAAITGSIAPIAGLVPLLVLTGAPAVVIALRAGEPLQAIPLFVLYLAYGLARTLDLVGLARKGKTWRARPPLTRS